MGQTGYSKDYWDQGSYKEQGSYKDRGSHKGSYQERSRQVTCPCCRGTGLIDERVPAWASFELTPQSLRSFCENNEVDDAACQQCFLLVKKYGNEGKKGVVQILSTLLSKWEYINNASAYVAASCIKWKPGNEHDHAA